MEMILKEGKGKVEVGGVEFDFSYFTRKQKCSNNS